jgi:hypothetical protein
MTSQSGTNVLLLAILAMLILGLGFSVMNMPDQRTPGQKIGDAIGSLGDGVDRAARQLQDRTPAQKLHDAGQDIRRSLNGQ